MPTRLTTAQRSRCFGAHGAQQSHVTVATPWGLEVRCHRLLVALFTAACRDAGAVLWNPRRIDSYNNRRIAGTDEWSLHSWALAWDFFVTPPGVEPPGGVWKPDNPVPVDFARCFTLRGFVWGASFAGRADWAHIEWPWAPPAAISPPPQEDGVPLVDVLADPKAAQSRGGWALLEDGTIRPFRGARTLGEPAGHSYWTGRKAKRFEPVGDDYAVIATSGERYGPGFD